MIQRISIRILRLFFVKLIMIHINIKYRYLYLYLDNNMECNL